MDADLEHRRRVISTATSEVVQFLRSFPHLNHGMIAYLCGAAYNTRQPKLLVHYRGSIHNSVINQRHHI